jgi:hypothetical protein
VSDRTEIEGRLRMMLPIVNGPKQGSPHIVRAQLNTEVTMLSQCFDESTPSTELLIQYPVQVEQVVATTFLGPEEKGEIRLMVHNLSTRDYGNRDWEVGTLRGDISGGAEASWGGVEIALTTDLLIEIMDPRLFGKYCGTGDDEDEGGEEEDGGDEEDGAYNVKIATADAVDMAWHYRLEGPTNERAREHPGTKMRGNSCVIFIERIGPKSSVEVTIPIRMRPEAGNVLMESLPWRAVLHLRNRPIEARAAMVRVVPRFNPTLFSDVCLVSSPPMNRQEFLAWSYLLQLLDVSVNIWDVERYGGLTNTTQQGETEEERNLDSWTGRCRTAVLPRYHGVVSDAEQSVGRVAGRRQHRIDLSTLGLEDCIKHLGVQAGGFQHHQSLSSALADRTAEAIRLEGAMSEQFRSLSSALGSIRYSWLRWIFCRCGGFLARPFACCRSRSGRSAAWDMDELKQDLLEGYTGAGDEGTPRTKFGTAGSLHSGGDDDGDRDGDRDGSPRVQHFGRADLSSVDSVQRTQPTGRDRLNQQFDGVYSTALGEVQAQYKDEAGRAVGNGLLLLGFDHNDAWHLNYEASPCQHTDQYKSRCCCLRCSKAEVDPIQLLEAEPKPIRWGGCHPCVCCQSDYSLLRSADSVAGRLQLASSRADQMHRYTPIATLKINRGGCSESQSGCCSASAGYGELAMYKGAHKRSTPFMAIPDHWGGNRTMSSGPLP